MSKPSNRPSGEMRRRGYGEATGRTGRMRGALPRLLALDARRHQARLRSGRESEAVAGLDRTLRAV